MKKDSGFQLEPAQQYQLARQSPKQKAFNRLIEKIEQERKNLAAWQDFIPRYQEKYARDYWPQLEQYQQKRIEWVTLLDKAHAEYKFGKNQSLKLSCIIRDAADALIDETDREDLKELYNKHSGADYDEEIEEEEAITRLMAEKMFGVELEEDFDFNSPDAFLGAIHRKMEEETARKKKKTKKSAKALAKEKREEEEEKNINQAIREIFRKLAQDLHPDREQDVIERERKSDLMKRVNVAYKAKDLLGLLELQLEVEQIDHKHIATLSDERLGHYNKILARQLEGIEQEVLQTCGNLLMQYNLPSTSSMFAPTVMRNLTERIRNIEEKSGLLEQELKDFQDVKNIKGWLKTIRLQKVRQPVFFDF